MQDFRISAYTLTCSAGVGLSALRESLWDRKTGLRRNDFPYSHLDTWIGRVDAADDFVWDARNSHWESRNNALAAVGLEQDDFTSTVATAAKKFGAERIGVVIGSSTSSIGRTEAGYRELDDANHMPKEFQQPEVHNSHSPGAFVAHWCGLGGPCMTIGTACSSSAKVFATAVRWMTAGLADAVVVGGVDSLCLSVMYGFNSLELISPQPCRPFDTHRDGINIGEAAGYALLVRAQDAPADAVRFAGYGESSDAHHMAHPHPEGLGAEIAMRAALRTSGLTPQDIGYINLHGTASRVNDAIETEAIARLFTDNVCISSTKGWTGHTLGAAGIVDGVIALEALQHNHAPGTLNLDELDPALAFPVLQANEVRELSHVMSNSFGFGGNNCCLIFSRPTA